LPRRRPQVARRRADKIITWIVDVIITPTSAGVLRDAKGTRIAARNAAERSITTGLASYSPYDLTKKGTK